MRSQFSILKWQILLKLRRTRFEYGKKLVISRVNKGDRNRLLLIFEIKILMILDFFVMNTNNHNTGWSTMIGDVNDDR